MNLFSLRFEHAKYAKYANLRSMLCTPFFEEGQTHNLMNTRKPREARRFMKHVKRVSTPS